MEGMLLSLNVMEIIGFHEHRQEACSQKYILHQPLSELAGFHDKFGNPTSKVYSHLQPTGKDELWLEQLK
jgi:hypothetical protein